MPSPKMAATKLYIRELEAEVDRLREDLKATYHALVSGDEHKARAIVSAYAGFGENLRSIVDRYPEAFPHIAAATRDEEQRHG